MTYNVASMLKGKVKGLMPLCLLALLSLTVSCSEESGDDFNQAEWQKENEAYFEKQYQEHLSASSPTCFVLPNWSMPESTAISALPHTSCILVDVLAEGDDDETDCPLYTDSVKIHYSGRLIPTDDYPIGYEFDRSYLLNKLDPEVDPPVTMSVKSLTDGFCTALQHMHRGDMWQIIVPYQLGYGSSTSSAYIPPYSTLVFQVYLEDFWQLQEGDRR